MGRSSGTRLKHEFQELPEGTSTLGMWVFLIALGVLFASSVVGFLLVEQDGSLWLPDPSPWLLAGLAASTALLFVNALCLHKAMKSLKTASQANLAGLTRAAAVTGTLFVFMQVANWVMTHANQQPTISGAMPNGFFYMLSGLHALHVVGGLPHLWIVATRASAGRYTPTAHDGLRNATLYWHFLDIVWLIALAVTLLFSP